MTNLEKELSIKAAEAIKEVYKTDVSSESIAVNLTKKDFEGDYTLVTFPLARTSKKSPEETANDLGSFLEEHWEIVDQFNTVKGFLNLNFKDSFWLNVFNEMQSDPDYGKHPPTGNKVVLEYIGPNTNKPLHLGHIRNMLLGFSIGEILEARGHEVVKVNIYNDRGIAICKSMVAWLRNGEGKTPESTGIKGDHFVGQFYVEYAKIEDEESKSFLDKGMEKEEAAKETSVYKEAQEMLIKWEAGDKEVRALWKKMNGWVYEGFNETYKKLGVGYKKAYHESDTYILGKNLVEEGLEKGCFYKKEDGSVWVDLTDEGLDEKILLRSDGTSVYLTQDLGTAQERFKDFKMNDSLYVVGNEQDYHFQVLKLTLQKLGKEYADGIRHISYGMVDLPEGKMKSREGKTIDADDLVEEMVSKSEEHTIELGKIEDLDESERGDLFRILGLGALKYFILKVQAKKRMLFNPEQSIELQGDTGPFVQYTYARIQAILRRDAGAVFNKDNINLNPSEKELIKILYRLAEVVDEAARNYDPSVIASYTIDLAKLYNRFYAEVPVLKAESDDEKNFRISLSKIVGEKIRFCMALLGIEVPDQM
ncbi:MAG: arginine--tRNA ligase [Chitinophagales bacterium]|nr:arginine--tRNA ligase [Chitinophagales bacterium]